MDARKISPALTVANYAQAGSLPTGGLVCHLDVTNFRSYPGAAPTIFDLSGQGNNLTLFNTPTYADTQGGKAFTFNGTNQYGQIQNTGSLSNFTSGMTVIAVANMGTANTWARLIDFGGGPTSNNILIARQATTNTLYCEFYVGASSSFTHAITDGVLNSQWAFYAWSFDTSRSIVNVNGTMYTTSKSTTMPTNTSRTINYVGRSNWAADSYFNGSIQTLLIYNRFLTQSQLSSAYNFFQRRFSF